jgi:hypothetical protein
MWCIRHPNVVAQVEVGWGRGVFFVLLNMSVGGMEQGGGYTPHEALGTAPLPPVARLSTGGGRPLCRPLAAGDGVHGRGGPVPSRQGLEGAARSPSTAPHPTIFFFLPLFPSFILERCNGLQGCCHGCLRAGRQPVRPHIYRLVMGGILCGPALQDSAHAEWPAPQDPHLPGTQAAAAGHASQGVKRGVGEGWRGHKAPCSTFPGPFAASQVHPLYWCGLCGCTSSSPPPPSYDTHDPAGPHATSLPGCCAEAPLRDRHVQHSQGVPTRTGVGPAEGACWQRPPLAVVAGRAPARGKVWWSEPTP